MGAYACPNAATCPNTADSMECIVFSAGLLPHEAETMVINGFPRDEMTPSHRAGEVVVHICEQTLADAKDPRTHAFEHTWSPDRKGPGVMYPVLSGRMSEIARTAIGQTKFWTAVSATRNK